MNNNVNGQKNNPKILNTEIFDGAKWLLANDKTNNAITPALHILKKNLQNFFHLVSCAASTISLIDFLKTHVPYSTNYRIQSVQSFPK